jgi:hypothetical protein
MRHMPLNESLEYEDLTIHIPGGGTEEIIIHTDFAPPTPRLSINDEQLTLMPVISFHFIQIVFDFYLFSYRFKTKQVNNFNMKMLIHNNYNL